VREVVESSNGTVVARFDYTPFGVLEKIGTPSIGVEFGFTGHFTHEDSGLVLSYYRAYDPELGRWLSPDPLGEEGGVNLYGYVNNRPVNSFDALGLVGSYGGYGGGFGYNKYVNNVTGAHLSGGWTSDQWAAAFDWGEIGNDLSESWFSFVDGVWPGDPMADMGAYDRCDKWNKWTRDGGQLYRDLLLLATGLKALQMAGANVAIESGISVSANKATLLGLGTKLSYSLGDMAAAAGFSQSFVRAANIANYVGLGAAAYELANSAMNGIDFLNGVEDQPCP
jgi:RHS repeat-associated protein